MNNVKELTSYKNEGEIDLDKIINDFSPYIRKIINNMVGENLSYEDIEDYDNYISHSDIDVFLEERIEIERCLKILKIQ